jgi:hypothetical protein
MYRISTAVNETSDGTLAGAVFASYGRNASLSGGGNLSATRTPVMAVNVGDTADGALSAATFQRLNAAATFTGSGSLAATARIVSQNVAVTLTGSGALTGAARMYGINVAVGDFSDGILSGAAYPAYSRSAAINGSGSLSATSAVVTTPALTASGGISAVVVQRRDTNVALSGSGGLAGTARMYSQNLAVAESADGTLSGATYGVYGRSATLSGSGGLAGTARMYSQNLAVPLAGSGTLSAAAAAVTVVSASVNFSATGQLSSTAKVPPAYNSVGAMSRGATNSSSSPGTVTWTHTVPTTANRMALAFIYLQTPSGTTATTTVPTLGGTAMTLVTSVTTADGQFWVYSLANPATGAQTASWSATRTAGAGGIAWMANTVIYTGVSAVAASGSAIGTASNASVTTSAIASGVRAVGSLAGAGLTNFNTMTATGGTTGALRFNNGQNTVHIGIADALGLDAQITFAITATAQTTPWGGLWVSLSGV